MVTEIGLLECPVSTPSDLCLCGWMYSKVSGTKTDIRDELLARILDAAANKRNVKINSDEQHSIFAHELQSALRLILGTLIVISYRFVI